MTAALARFVQAEGTFGKENYGTERERSWEAVVADGTAKRRMLRSGGHGEDGAGTTMKMRPDGWPHTGSTDARFESAEQPGSATVRFERKKKLRGKDGWLGFNLATVRFE